MIPAPAWIVVEGRVIPREPGWTYFARFHCVFRVWQEGPVPPNARGVIKPFRRTTAVVGNHYRLDGEMLAELVAIC